MARTITPHLALVVICIAYMLVGALIFQVKWYVKDRSHDAQIPYKDMSCP